jgi:hypothetical protein
MSSELPPHQQRDSVRVSAWLADAWSEAYRSRIPDSLLLEFEEVATFLFDQAGALDAPQADRTIRLAGNFRQRQLAGSYGRLSWLSPRRRALQRTRRAGQASCLHGRAAGRC